MNPLKGMEPRRVPAELRERVLAAARAGASTGASPNVWDALWESRLWRLAWTGSTLALIVAHAVVAWGTQHPVVPSGAASARQELEEILGLPEVAGELPELASGPVEVNSETLNEKGRAS